MFGIYFNSFFDKDSKIRFRLTIRFPHWFDHLIINHKDDSCNDHSCQTGLGYVGTVRHHKNKCLEIKEKKLKEMVQKTSNSFLGSGESIKTFT